MAVVYVTGHKNPDTDSIVSAMAYAALKNALGERDVVAVRLGEINNETLIVLERFGFEPPMLISNVRTQLSDVVFDRPPIVGSSVTVRTAWNIMNDHNVQSICIADEDGYLVGFLSTGDVAAHDMNSALSGFIINTTAFNLASTLEGYLISSEEESSLISGPIQICVHDKDHIPEEAYTNSLLISGNRDNIIEIAQQADVACLVLCQVDADSPVAQKAKEAGMHVVLTHYDPYRASRLISHSVPVSSMVSNEQVNVFHETDFLNEVRDVMQKNRSPSYPVLNEHEKVVGTLSRYHLLNHNRKKVILVDHNEPGQSVTGIEEAELLEVIDHHRLGNLETSNPIKMRIDAVGSATTIVASLYFEYGVTPKKQMAGLIAGAILSDTVMFKSPTCTEKDKRMAYRMAQLAGIDLNKLAVEIFSATATIGDRDPKSLVTSDLKEFKIGDFKVGIGQVTCMNIKDLEKMDEEILTELNDLKEKNNFDYVFFMETEIVHEGTKLLFVGKAQDVIKSAFDIMPAVNQYSVYLPSVMSRKKQIVPAISAVLAS